MSSDGRETVKFAEKCVGREDLIRFMGRSVGFRYHSREAFDVPNVSSESSGHVNKETAYRDHWKET